MHKMFLCLKRSKWNVSNKGYTQGRIYNQKVHTSFEINKAHNVFFCILYNMSNKKI